MARFVQRRAFPVLALAAAAALVAAGLLGACTEKVRLGLDVAIPAGSSPEAGPSEPPFGGAGSLGLSGGAGGEFPVGGAGSEPLDAAPGPALDAGPCIQLACDNTGYRACGDCIDNDGDGRIDASDPECLGPCDNSELELQRGSINVSGSCRADCYFDRNRGMGGDNCTWSFDCDPQSVAPDFFPTGRSMCEFDPTVVGCDDSDLGGCSENCFPLTPNGCDCFGCCELPARSNNFVWLGSEDLASPCTPVAGCQNTCDECELCVGETEVPASCSGSPAPRCRAGVAACDPRSFLDCGSAEYCVTGCCAPLPR